MSTSVDRPENVSGGPPAANGRVKKLVRALLFNLLLHITHLMLLRLNSLVILQLDFEREENCEFK